MLVGVGWGVLVVAWRNYGALLGVVRFRFGSASRVGTRRGRGFFPLPVFFPDPL